MICKNCGHDFEGNFCNNCGQKAGVKRIDAAYLLEELSSGIFKINKGILFTVKELFLRPGLSIREFLRGKRKPHIKPLSFLLLVSAIYVFSTYFTGKNTLLEDLIEGFNNGFEGDEQGEMKSSLFLHWLASNHVYFSLLLLPFFSFASLLAFKEKGYNYFEHIVLNLYISGQQLVIYMILGFLLIGIAEKSPLESLPICVGIAYVFWTFIEFFEKDKKWATIGRTLLTYFYFLIQMVLLSFLLVYIEFGIT